MSSAKVTIDLSEYNKLLDDSKKYNQGFEHTVIKEKYSTMLGNYSEIISSNDDSVKKLVTEMLLLKSRADESVRVMTEYSKLPSYKRLFYNVCKGYIDKLIKLQQ